MFINWVFDIKIDLELIPLFSFRVTSPLTGYLTIPLGFASGWGEIAIQKWRHSDLNIGISAYYIYQLMHLGYLIGGQLRGMLSDTKFRTGKRSVPNSSGRVFTVVVAENKSLACIYLMNSSLPVSPAMRHTSWKPPTRCVPMMMSRSRPPTIITVWNVSVHTTALIPPCRHNRGGSGESVMTNLRS